jgi:hypothetical protein
MVLKLMDIFKSVTVMLQYKLKDWMAIAIPHVSILTQSPCKDNWIWDFSDVEALFTAHISYIFFIKILADSLNLLGPTHNQLKPIPVAARSKASVCGRSLTGTAVSNPSGGHACLSLVSVVCCQVEVSATGWSLVQRSPTECGVSECDREASTVGRPWPRRGCRAIGR